VRAPTLWHFLLVFGILGMAGAGAAITRRRWTLHVLVAWAAGLALATVTSPVRALRMGVLLLALGAVPAPAQRPPLTQRLDSGVVVRLRLLDGSRERARLFAPFAPESQAVSYCAWPGAPCERSGSHRVTRPAREVLGLEVHRGSQWKLGGIIGAVVGVPMGYSLISFSEFMGERRLSESERVRAIAGSVVGWALFGVMIGEFFQRWGPAP
jgi:hypothetical protein